ncbi:MAG: hypothetical protein K6G22_06935 [Lachnospiraceae bacterium]|nr:hypothetical protein [Lachnospiraceae bacterium]
MLVVNDDNGRAAKKTVCLYDWYYILVIFAYILTLVSLKIRPGVIAAGLMLIVLLQLFINRRIRIKTLTDIFTVIYFAYNVLSVIPLILSGLPVTVYLNEFAVSILPMVFYFAGRGYDGLRFSDENEASASFYEKFIFAMLIVGFLGIYFHIFAPDHYIQYSYELNFISKADAATSRVRMDSVIGCTLLGAMGVTGMLAGSYFIDKRECFKDLKKTRLKGIIYIFCNFVFAVLSNQRSAMVASFIVIIYINYLLFKQFDIIRKKYFKYEVAAVFILLAALWAFDHELLLKIWWRLESLPSAISERSEQWIAAINNMYSTWFGNGLGANGHKALGIENTHVIADGGLVKLYCEEGIIGFSIYVYLLIMTLKKGLLNIRKYYVETGIICMALLQSIGSNIIAFQLALPVFWYAVGRINSESADTGSEVVMSPDNESRDNESKDNESEAGTK